MRFNLTGKKKKKNRTALVLGEFRRLAFADKSNNNNTEQYSTHVAYVAGGLSVKSPITRLVRVFSLSAPTPIRVRFRCDLSRLMLTTLV